MKRITISLPDEIEAAVQREARRRRVPLSQVIRERLESGYGAAPGTRRIAFAALGRSGRHDTARSVDAILAAEWTPVISKRPRRAKTGARSR